MNNLEYKTSITENGYLIEVYDQGVKRAWMDYDKDLNPLFKRHPMETQQTHETTVEFGRELIKSKYK